MIKPERANRLAAETSPYLLQHAENPVDWYPWGDEALVRARKEDRPILLSIGYSACHWCHVMAHESFEDHDTATLMNCNFINVKVDREERPDIDSIYMDAVQAMTGSGGWPLTVFLTPEGKPFYGGTYFPPEDRYGMPGFRRVLTAVVDFYRNRRTEVEQATHQITGALRAVAGTSSNISALSIETTDHAFSNLKPDHDTTRGGFGGAPKFPQPLTLDFLLRYYHRTDNKEALDMVTLSLEKMAGGGIYDQIGGGFHRYSTDAAWLVPHFEKMLYDNALLSRTYLHAYLLTGSPLFRRITEETIDYVLREMTDPDGGFYSSQDADSEGVEGKYYLWTPQEVAQVLGRETANTVNEYFGVTERGNFEGRSILQIPGDVSADEPDTIKRAKASLRQAREQRIRPARDDKVLTSWNGMMLASLAEAGCVLDRDDYRKAAMANGSFLLNTSMSDRYLKHTSRDGESSVEGYLEDYAMLIDGLVTLHQATFGGLWLSKAIALANSIVDLFWDESAGMLYDTGTRHETLFIRPRSTHDGAMPSGSSAAALALTTVSRLTGDRRYEEIAAKSLKALQEKMSRYPLGFGNWLCALDFHLSPPQEVVIAGTREDADAAGLLPVLFSKWLPTTVVAAVDPTDRYPADHLSLLENRPMIDDRPTVYLCQHSSCRAPVTDPDSLQQYLLS